jgi:hypothetical protein
MKRVTYDWSAADRAIRNALGAIVAAQRHLAHRKRVNVLKDLIRAEDETAKAFEALESARFVPTVDTVQAREHSHE